ncbi:MAG TPA: periplasmic heavy metal sensor [Gemmatimonadales bacterium]|nr:periplasmic heavy metal sensor [Gemmatimonadales bacterium]
MQTGTWKAVAMLALAAVAGGVVGSAITASAVRDDHGARGHGPTWYIDLLDRELKLTPAQRDSVRAILDRREGSMDSILAEMRPRIDAVRQVIRGEISAQLSPAQQQQYRDLTARLDAERRERNQRESKQK